MKKNAEGKIAVYLAGPITGLDYNGSTDWREAAKRYLAEHGIVGLSPMRGKEYLVAVGVISGHGNDYRGMSPLSDPAGVLARDYWDCCRCDIVLANLMGAKAVSIGTVMEIAWAHAQRKPVVLAMEDSGNPHEHMMVTSVAAYRVNNLDAALDLIGAIACP